MTEEIRGVCSEPEHCNTQHLSNFSLAVQYGEDEMPPTPCDCKCHLKEENLHGNAARARQKREEKK